MTRKNCKAERNDELLRDYAEGHGRKYLAKKYNLSETRVRNLIAFYYLNSRPTVKGQG